MIKYLKQRDYYSCAPTAIINAMKWSGKNPTRKSHLKKLIKECKCCNKCGSEVENIDGVVRKYFSHAKYKSQESTNTLSAHLRKGGAVILAYEYVKNDGIREAHCTFCIDRTKYYYILVNDVKTSDGTILPNTISMKSRKSVAKMLKINNDMWLI